MFPESLRNFTSSTIDNSINLTQTLFRWSKVGLWVFGSSFTVLVLPIICEQERSTVEEQQTQQQRQILLGPSATVSSAPNLLPGMPLAAK
jgi:import receptor subunit TOM22